MKRTIVLAGGFVDCSDEAIAALRARCERYAIIQSTDRNRIAVRLVNELGRSAFLYFGGPLRSRRARQIARDWVNPPKIRP